MMLGTFDESGNSVAVLTLIVTSLISYFCHEKTTL
jgi:hypothetical protein